MGLINETELIRGCIRRDRAAQKRMYEMYSPVMYPICCRYVKNSMEAEDVLVVAFTKILNKIDQYKGTGSFEGWMKRIVINEALVQIRSQRSMFLTTDIDEVESEIEDADNHNHLEEEDLMKMIMQLPAGYRSVFNLYAIDGYSHKEIAAELGISENTSKSQLSRARVFLQKLLIKSEAISNSKQHDVTAR
jgi:RNA polymerase sigma factor (sigma-70 family)